MGEHDAELVEDAENISLPPFGTRATEAAETAETMTQAAPSDSTTSPVPDVPTTSEEETQETDDAPLEEIPESTFGDRPLAVPRIPVPRMGRPGFTESIVKMMLSSATDGQGAFVLRNGTRYEFLGHDEVSASVGFVTIQRVVRYQGDSVSGGSTIMFPLAEISSLEIS